MDSQIDIAFQALAGGPITMYHDIRILENDLVWYKENNYKVYDFDTTNWTIGQAHSELKKKMGFPHYYGNNLNAFNDCLGDTFTKEMKGQVIVFRHFDKFSKSEKDFCLGLLDIIADVSRSWLLDGERLIGIIQSDDPYISYDKVGGNKPYWNRQEWLDSNRIKK
ncbi:MAG: barstar family protein [Flavobacteriales bacterium]|nr:barstar family protein [Flavobacteriales bacterium]